MRNRGRNYSRKSDRDYPGYTVKAKSGSEKTLYRYRKSGTKASPRRRSYKRFQPTFDIPNEVFIFLAGLILTVYFLEYIF